MSATDKRTLLEINCNIPLVGYIFWLYPISKEMKHMDSLKRLRIVGEKHRCGQYLEE